LNVSNITVSHVAMTNCGSGYDYNQIGIYSFPASGTNMLLSYSYIANSSTNFQLLNWIGGEISNNFFDNNWSSPNYHGQQISPKACTDIIFKNNIMRNSFVGGIGFHKGVNDPSGNVGWKVYNNIAYNTDGRGVTMGIFGNADTREGVVLNSEFHHNTIIGITGGGGRGSAIQFDGQTVASGNTV
ncbi:MAG: hypothetical protein AAB948_03540, partial [Patescibacteria group bacterium]